jgi:hypothetical protein
VRPFVLLAIALLGCSADLTAQAAGASGPLNIVARLYRDFAGIAVIDDPELAGEVLIEQPRAVLARYFDETLVGLILKDRACVARTREVCNLDFDPLFESQDPVGSTVKILPTRDPSVVSAKLRQFERPEVRELKFRLVNTAAGWRVSDIDYGADGTLLGILKMP